MPPPPWVLSAADSSAVGLLPQAGEKQKSRGYDVQKVMAWFAQHADRILLLFDPYKLDISDEFKKVRVYLHLYV